MHVYILSILIYHLRIAEHLQSKTKCLLTVGKVGCMDVWNTTYNSYHYVLRQWFLKFEN